MFLKKFNILLYLFFSCFSLFAEGREAIGKQTHAAGREAIWEQTYYDSVSRAGGGKTPYCDTTTPGTFVGTVKGQLNHGTITDKNIKLSEFTFNEKKHRDRFVLYGTVLERDENHNGRPWTDKIHYDLRKSGKYGLTTGTWYNSQCRGDYKGKVIGWTN